MQERGGVEWEQGTRGKGQERKFEGEAGATQSAVGGVGGWGSGDGGREGERRRRFNREKACWRFPWEVFGVRERARGRGINRAVRGWAEVPRRYTLWARRRLPLSRVRRRGPSCCFLGGGGDSAVFVSKDLCRR